MLSSLGAVLSFSFLHQREYLYWPALQFITVTSSTSSTVMSTAPISSPKLGTSSAPGSVPIVVKALIKEAIREELRSLTASRTSGRPSPLAGSSDISSSVRVSSSCTSSLPMIPSSAARSGESNETQKNALTCTTIASAWPGYSHSARA